MKAAALRKTIPPLPSPRQRRRLGCKTPCLSLVRFRDDFAADGTPLHGVWEVCGRGWRDGRPVLFLYRDGTQLAAREVDLVVVRRGVPIVASDNLTD